MMQSGLRNQQQMQERRMMSIARKTIDAFGSLIQAAEVSESSSNVLIKAFTSLTEEEFDARMKDAFKEMNYRRTEKKSKDGCISCILSRKQSDCLKKKIYADANDINERNALLKMKDSSNVIEFRHMPLSMVEKLEMLDGGIKPDFKAAYAPKQSRFIDWMKMHDCFLASGFATSATRKDCGVYIDSIEAWLPKEDMKTAKDFHDAFSDATCFVSAEDDGRQYVCCWYE